MLILIAALGFIGFVFGMKALRTVVVIGIGAVVLYFVAALHTLQPQMQRAVAEREQAAALEAARPPPDRSPAPKCPDSEHLAWISTENVTELRPARGEREHWECVGGLHVALNQRHGKPTAQALPPPAPVATAPASPASDWELLPWPPDAPDAGSPSPAAQRLLDRLNGWAK